MNINDSNERYKDSASRLLIVDWSSMCYQQLFNTTRKMIDANCFPTDQYGKFFADDEMKVWKNSMMFELTDIIRKFNPMDIIVANDTSKPWRFDYVKEYYDQNTEVYWDDKSYYVKFDNVFNKITKTGDDLYDIDDVDPASKLPENKSTLGELSPRANDMIWNIYRSSGRPLLPVYKGQRRTQEWPLSIDKKDWRIEKDAFLNEIAPLFRMKVVDYDRAEADDVIYVAVTKTSADYKSIVVVSRDGDLLQLMEDNRVVIYDHVARDLKACIDPKKILESKILSGDSSDNINGLALPGKKRKIGKAGAMKLLESVGWYNDLMAHGESVEKQYIRNKKLVDLSCTPTHIQEAIVKLLESDTTTIKNSSEMSFPWINDDLLGDIKRMEMFGFYTMVGRDYAIQNPESFKKETFVEDEGKSSYTLDVRPARYFDDLDSVFVPF